MIKAIFLDLDDTLLWDHKSIEMAFAATCKIAKERYGIEPEQLEEAVREEAHRLYSSYETYSFTKLIGINPFEGLWADFNDEGEEFQALKKIAPSYRRNVWISGLLRLGIDDPCFGYELSQLFQKNPRKFPLVYDDTFPILEELHAHYRLLLLTNGSPSLQKTKLELSPQLSPYFEKIVISGEIGSGKPNKAIFEHALSLMVLERNEVLMVGDNLNSDIKGAIQTGIRSVWINRQKKRRGNGIAPTFEISSLYDLPKTIQIINQIKRG